MIEAAEERLDNDLVRYDGFKPPERAALSIAAMIAAGAE
jgi:hypothetical protein